MANEFYEIRLTNPCQQKWQGMHPSAAGRFCSACEKEVIDFTQFSNLQLIDYFVANKIKEGCVRFLKPQIAEIKIPVDSQVFQKPIPQWKKFLLLLLVCFGKNLFNAEVVFSQRIENDSVRFSMLCDSSLPSETFDINDTLKIDEIKTPEVVDEPEPDTFQENLVIKDSFVFETLKIDLKDINMVLGGFGVYPEKECSIPLFEENEIADSTLIEEAAAGILFEPPISKTLRLKEDISLPGNLPRKKESSNKMPFEAILLNNKPKKRRRN